jgi:hypothetical protein
MGVFFIFFFFIFFYIYLAVGKLIVKTQPEHIQISSHIGSHQFLFACHTSSGSQGNPRYAVASETKKEKDGRMTPKRVAGLCRND